MSTRGIRNHNPGNIEFNSSIAWKGQLGIEKHERPRFARFSSPEYGIRAIGRLLRTYHEKHGLNTVRGVINRWAPPVENNTSAYVNAVANRVGVTPDEQLTIGDYDVIYPLVEAIIRHENGSQPYSGTIINNGLRLAGYDVPSKPLSKSRSVAGAGLSGVGALGAQLQESAGLLAGIEEMQWVYVALIVAGVALTVWAAIDRRKRGIE